MKNWNTHNYFINLALEEAEKAYKLDEVPVGAVIVSPTEEVISKAHNLKETKNNPCGHAEIIALTLAGKQFNSWRLEGCRVYVTLEPCAMCLGAMVHARIKNLFFGAYDFKSGALSLGNNFYKDSRLNHKFSVFGGFEHYRCSSLLSNFFSLKRKFHKKP